VSVNLEVPMQINPTIPIATTEPGSDPSKRTGPVEINSFGWSVKNPPYEAELAPEEDDLEGPREPEDE